MKGLGVSLGVRHVCALGALVSIVACGGSEPAPQPPPVSVTPLAPPTASPPAQDAGAAAERIPTPDPVKYPPPRPTTISLATTQNADVNALLKQGDDAFEANDLATAASRYQGAGLMLAMGGKIANEKTIQAAAKTGLARVKIAKENVPYDFAAAKGNAGISAAASDLKKAAKMDPSFGPADVELGRALLLLGDAQGAIDALKKGATLLPNEPEAHSALGIAWLATGHPDEAMVEMGQAAKLDPGSAARHGNYGTTLLMKGKTKEAIDEYRAAVAIDDSDARAHSDLGTALLGDNQVTSAVPELRRAIELDPSRATFHSNLGYALQTMGKLPDAEKEYQAALKIDPKLASAWINLATLLAKDPKRRTEARAALEKARAIDPTDPRVKANLEELDSLH